MGYIEDINNIDILTLDDIIRVSRKYVSLKNQQRPWYCSGLDHGTAVLSNEDQLCCYIASYGEMHKEKIDKALQNFPWRELTSDIEIIDWGCGQGIASVHFATRLREFNLLPKLRKVSLIEPSKLASERARLNVLKAVGRGVKIDVKQVYLPSVTSIGDELTSLHIEENICIHLFSNILDIVEIDLKKLASIISSTGYRHYFLCMGPVNYGNNRLEAFCRYFAALEEDKFSNTFAPQYKQLANGKWYGCVTRGFKMLREEGKPFLIPLSFFPPKEFAASYKLDAMWHKDGDPYVCNNAYFNVLAPFDIGASVYTDVDPIMAVLNNIVTRGLSTKCSPFVEDLFADILGATKRAERYGTISYPAKNEELLGKYESYCRSIPVGIAWIQKTVIEAIITGRLSTDMKEWNVVVKEDGIPCSAIAFEDLARMFNHLCALTQEFSSRTFPKVNLSIITSRNGKSKFHLGNTTYTSSKELNRERVYDLVIDISLTEDSDPEHVQFSEFKVNNECYFNIRKCDVQCPREIYTTDRILYKPLTQLNREGGFDEIPESVEHLNYLLTLLFRKKAFRPGQLPILNRAMQNKGVIGLLPTGGGKSLTYQLAAMLQPGITVIIDPLKSLMEDQYDGLRAVGIDACTYINSELRPEVRSMHEDLMESSRVIMTFMSPERLCIYPFRERLNNMHELGVYFSYGVIDEVHCVSEWGQDFRPSYLHLGRNMYQYLRAKNGRISLFGLTATASFDVLSDVERELSGHGAFVLDPETIVRYENSNRLELQYKVERVEMEYTPDKFDDHGLLHNYPTPVKLQNNSSVSYSKSNYLQTLLPKIPGYMAELLEKQSLENIVRNFREREELASIDCNRLLVDIQQDFLTNRDEYQFAGIVFCPHVNSSGVSVNHNARELSKICEVGSFAGSKQADEADNKSMENMRLFRDNKLPLMVATKAFGMGIDKPNVRFTVNMNYSSSLESFIQEAGRAGRDGHMALSLILLSDYKLARIKPSCRNFDQTGILFTIRGKWYKEEDLKLIINDFKLNVSPSDIDICNPLTDFVQLQCNTDNKKITKDGKEKKDTWNCSEECSKFGTCQLRHIDRSLRWQWIYYPDLKNYLRQNNIRISASDFKYNGPDYGNVMYFFDQNFKGEFEEKKKMHELLSVKEVQYFTGNDGQYKPTYEKCGNGFIEALFNAKIGEELVVFIPYDNDSYQDIAKAIYRMCVIGLIDDFTQDYSRHAFRVVTVRKKTGSYYLRLKDFLTRYFSEERAENEVERASVRKGKNEIHKCLGYLTEFVYDKVVMKRKRAIDDMRNFCITGIDDTKDWKEINEDLKDEIFYYFNSKFAREGYRTDTDEPFSLKDEIVEDKKRDFDTLFKYMRVIDNDVIGNSGSPKDNIKHLRGAVRLIRRGETDTNPVLSLLNVFCLMIMRQKQDEPFGVELKDSYSEGYKIFKEECHDKEVFYSLMERFYKEFTINNRTAASRKEIKQLKELQLLIELEEHESWLNNFKRNYIS